MPDDPLWAETLMRYPSLQNSGVAFQRTPKTGAGYLEFWPPDEEGSQDSPRPSSLPLGKPGVEVYDNRTTPLDVLGDIASHHLVKTDPQWKSYYDSFEQSLTPRQHAILKNQYAYAQQNEGEQRSYPMWYAQTGLPAYFRGYAFKQWDDPNGKYYSNEQRTMLDKMMKELAK